jgi:hypothetical protein
VLEFFQFVVEFVVQLIELVEFVVQFVEFVVQFVFQLVVQFVRFVVEFFSFPIQFVVQFFKFIQFHVESAGSRNRSCPVTAKRDIRCAVAGIYGFTGRSMDYMEARRFVERLAQESRFPTT